MNGNLNMGGNTIINVKHFIEDDSSQEANDAQRDQVIDFGFFKDERDHLVKLISDTESNLLPKDGSEVMEGDLDMDNHKIMNLKNPTAEDHAANKKYVDEMITNSEKRAKELIDQENVFKRVMDNDEFKEDDDDIHKIGAKNKDFHMINKKTYEFKIDYDSAIGYYSTRLSIDLIYIDAGSYTMVFEMYVDNGLTVDEIEGSSGTLSGVTTKSNIDGTKTRSIINFSYNGLASGFNDLDIDIKLKSKTDPQTTIYVVVYGVKGNFDDISVDLWDRLYYYNNESIKYEVSIDMKGKKITEVGNGTSNSDAVNYKQLIDYALISM